MSFMTTFTQNEDWNWNWIENLSATVNSLFSCLVVSGLLSWLLYSWFSKSHIHKTVFFMHSACRCRNFKTLKLCPLIQIHAVLLWVARCAHHDHVNTHLTLRGLIIWVMTDQKHHITWPTESMDSLQPSQRDQYYVVGFPWCGNTAGFFLSEHHFGWKTCSQHNFWISSLQR